MLVRHPSKGRGVTGRSEAIDFFLDAGPELLRRKVASGSSIAVVTIRFFSMIRQDQVAFSFEFPSQYNSHSMKPSGFAFHFPGEANDL